MKHFMQGFLVLLLLCSWTTIISYKQQGYASYYADKFHGRKTASGVLYDSSAMTCAHPKLPFGTQLEVIRLDNQKKVKVTVNDRGPFVKGRIIDLSKAAATQLDMIKKGVVKVEVSIIGEPR